MIEYASRWVVILGSLLFIATTSQADDVFWDGETSSDWQTGTNWQPQCSGGPFCVQQPPIMSDHAILASVGSLASDLATLSDHVLVNRLTIADGTSVNTSGYSLEVYGNTSMFGAGSSLILQDVEQAQNTFNAFTAARFHLANGAGILLGGPGLDRPSMRIDNDASTIGVGSFLSGTGSVNFNPNAVDSSTETSLINNGTIRARSGPLFVTSLEDNKLDLDGGTEAGVLDADDGTFLATNVSLWVDAPLADPFHGTMRIGEGDSISFLRSWQFGSPGQTGGVIELNGGNGAATLKGDPINMNGENLTTQINVVSGKGILDAEIDAATGQIAVAPDTTLHFKQRANLGSNAFLVGQDHYNLIVDDTLTLQQPQFDWDSPSPGSHDTIINEGAQLLINSNEINPTDNTFRGEVEINGGMLSVNTTTSWTLEGQMYLRRTGNNTARVFGAPLVVGDGFDTGDDARIEVTDGLSQIRVPITFRSDAELEITNGSALSFYENANLHSGVQVNGPGNIFSFNTMTLADGVSIGGHLYNYGTLNIGGNNQTGKLSTQDFTQAQAQGEIEERINLELQSTAAGDFDQLIVGGTATLSGTLGVDWLGSGLPSLGDAFPIITATNVTGMFDTLLLPPVEVGNVWSIQYNPTSVILEVIEPLTADFDNDGDVDGNDFLVWQRGGSPNPFSSSDLALWQAEYGSPLAATATVVPEPTTVVMLTSLALAVSLIFRS